MTFASIFSFAAFFLVFREVLEACLVVGVVLAYLNRTGQTPLRRWVWIAASAAAALSILIGGTFVGIYYSRRKQFFQGNAEHIFEGVTFLVAAALISWMLLWMLTEGRQMQLNEATDELVEHDSQGKVKAGVFGMVFIQVLREGIETFIFLTTAGGNGWRSIPLPAVLGAAIAVIVAYTVFLGLVDLDLSRFFKLTGLVMIAFAAGLVGHAMHELQEANAFGPWDAVAERPWWNWVLWSTHECCNDEENELFAFLRSLFGYQDSPTFVEIAAYTAFWLLVATISIFANWSALRRSKNAVARIVKMLTSSALFVGIVGLIIGATSNQWNGFLLGILIFFSSISAVIFAFDLFVSRMPASLAALRRPTMSLLCIFFGVITALSVALHFAQMACEDQRNACSLPRFYHYGVIFNQAWLERPPTSNSWTSLAILTLSLILTIVAGIGTTLGLMLFASNVQREDGAYVYEVDSEKSDFEAVDDSEETPTLMSRATSSKRVENPMLV